MEGLMKLLLFLVMVASVAVAGIRAYLYFNQKIIASSNFGRLFMYATLLVVVNIVIILAGLLILFGVYELLADV